MQTLQDAKPIITVGTLYQGDFSMISTYDIFDFTNQMFPRTRNVLGPQLSYGKKVSAAGSQCLDHFAALLSMTSGGCQIRRRTAAVVLGIDVSAKILQCPDRRSLTCLGCPPC